MQGQNSQQIVGRKTGVSEIVSDQNRGKTNCWRVGSPVQIYNEFSSVRKIDEK